MRWLPRQQPGLEQRAEQVPDNAVEKVKPGGRLSRLRGAMRSSSNLLSRLPKILCDVLLTLIDTRNRIGRLILFNMELRYAML